MSDTPSPPELTRLVKQVHSTPSGARTLTVSFLVSTQQTLMEDFDAAVHDAVLAHAHADGHLPVGPILHRLAPATSSQLGADCALCDGKGWLFEPGSTDCPDCDAGKVGKQPPGTWSTFEELEIENRIMMGDLIQVTASVELGLSL